MGEDQIVSLDLTELHLHRLFWSVIEWQCPSFTNDRVRSYLGEGRVAFLSSST